MGGGSNYRCDATVHKGGIRCFFLLNATIKHHVEKYTEVQPVLVEKILESIYVVGREDTEERAFQFYKESKQLLREGSFNLRKFVTNSPSLPSRIDQEENLCKPILNLRPSPSKMGNLDETYAQATLPVSPTTHVGEQKVLGVRWNPTNDHLVFDFRDVAEVAEELAPTKRNVIRL